MKIRGIIIPIVIATFAGVAIQWVRDSYRPNESTSSPIISNAPERPLQPKRIEPAQNIPVEPAARPAPKPTRTVDILPAETVPTAANPQPKPPPAKYHDPSPYWERQAMRFNRLLEQLSREENPEIRKRLIANLAGFVRVDTLSTMDWAMGLEDPNEMRAALEAINKYALSGIGARIEIDETGFPRIRETTVLSAVAATGQVEPGDYIVGMVTPDGEPISFQNISVQEVVKHLRGKPGSEIQLFVERVPAEENGESYTFDVSIQRSLLVIQPPY